MNLVYKNDVVYYIGHYGYMGDKLDREILDEYFNHDIPYRVTGIKTIGDEPYYVINNGFTLPSACFGKFSNYIKHKYDLK